MATISSHSSSNPLFSSIITLYILILLYFPHVFLKLLFSPILISTFILLLTLLRLGVSQQQSNVNPSRGARAPWLVIITPNGLKPEESESESESESNKVETNPKQEAREVVKAQCNVAKVHPTIKPSPKPEPKSSDPGQSIEIDSFNNHDPEKQKEQFQSWAGDQCLDWDKLEPGLGPEVFLEWDVGAPLEVIYEAYEGEEEGEDIQNDTFCKAGMLNRYPSLSRYYPESDSDSDSYSDSSSSSSSFYEEERGGLIEIALDNNYEYNYSGKKIISKVMKPKSGNQKVVDHCFDDEDNLIEIDISPTKFMYDFS